MTDNTMYMPVAPAYGGNGWGNNGNNGAYLGADIQRGFDQAAVTSG